MTLANLPHITHCGSPGIDRVPFGMQACHFYSDPDELVGALVPYIVAGLRGNERCIRATAPPLPAREAVQALRAALDDVDDAVSVRHLTDAAAFGGYIQWFNRGGSAMSGVAACRTMRNAPSDLLAFALSPAAFSQCPTK